MLTKRKVIAFLATSLFFLGGAFSSKPAVPEAAGPYGRMLASNWFVTDAQAHFECGRCIGNICSHEHRTYTSCTTQGTLCLSSFDTRCT